MNNPVKNPLAFILCFLLLSCSHSVAAVPGNISQLLDMVREGRIDEAKQHKQRETRFLSDKRNQQKNLKKTTDIRVDIEKQSARLEKHYEKNVKKIQKLQLQLDDHLGTLKELFSHLQTTAGSTAALFDNSIISAQFPGRSETLNQLTAKIANRSTLPTINDMEDLWYELQLEMAESGKITHFKTNVVNTKGEEQLQDIVRIGTFNLISNGQYLEYIPETHKIITYNRQPPNHFEVSATRFQSSHGNGELSSIGIDPTRGSILSALVHSPYISERIEQGGLVGYAILFLGAIGLLLGIERLVYLGLSSRRIKKQQKNPVANLNNPLGRIFNIYQQNKQIDIDTLELKLAKAILNEKAPLERCLSFMKIISVVAPLLGLLGTVTGMINTFQAITLFGTGDPKLMAGGISQALVTTVMGLCVAIPVVLLHTIVNSRSKQILGVLEEQSIGMIAEQAESSIQSKPMPHHKNGMSLT